MIYSVQRFTWNNMEFGVIISNAYIQKCVANFVETSLLMGSIQSEFQFNP